MQLLYNKKKKDEKEFKNSLTKKVKKTQNFKESSSVADVAQKIRGSDKY